METKLFLFFAIFLAFVLIFVAWEEKQDEKYGNWRRFIKTRIRQKIRAVVTYSLLPFKLIILFFWVAGIFIYAWAKGIDMEEL